MDAAREKLKLKLGSGSVDDKRAQVARLCVANLTALMRQSSCKREEVLAIGSTRAARTASSAPSAGSAGYVDPTEITVKAAIAKTVAESYRKAGKDISGDELASIVNR